MGKMTSGQKWGEPLQATAINYPPFLDDAAYCFWQLEPSAVGQGTCAK